MIIKQSRYITADTTGKKEMAIRTTELDKVKDDPCVRRSEVQQTVNNSTLPVSSRAVNLAINNIEMPSLDGYATEDYVDQKVGSIDLSSYASTAYVDGEIEEVGARIDSTDEKATIAKEGADRAEQAVNDSVGSGKLMREGAYGLGSTSIITPGSNLDDYTDPGFYGIASGADATTIENMPTKIISKSSMIVYSSSLTKVRNDCTQIITHFNSTLTAIRTYYAYLDRWTDWHYIYNTQNTTVDSNGFLKAASPIIKLFDDRIETNDQFKEEPIFKKIGVGTYKISNTLGLAKEGWTYEKPRGKDGNPYFHIKVDKLEDGCIISVHDEFEALEEATITDIAGNERKINKVVKILGEARDIKPHERWIDLRFHEEPEEVEDGGV